MALRYAIALLLYCSCAATTAATAADASTHSGDTPLPLYKQAGAPIPQRVADLVSRMTVDELVAAVAHKDSASLSDIKTLYGKTSIGGLKLNIVIDMTSAENTVKK